MELPILPLNAPATARPKCSRYASQKAVSGECATCQADPRVGDDALIWKADPQTQSGPTVVACQFLSAVIRPERSVLAVDLVQFRGGAWRYGGSRACRTPDEAALDQVDVFGGKRQGVLLHICDVFRVPVRFHHAGRGVPRDSLEKGPPRAAGRPGSGRGRRTEARPAPSSAAGAAVGKG